MNYDIVDISPRDDLPHYSLRVSTRAKRLQIRIDHWGRVEVVVPRNVSIAHAAPFVRKHRRWLERALAQVRAMHGDVPATTKEPPAGVYFPALDEYWEISYRQGSRTEVKVWRDLDGRRGVTVATPSGTGSRTPLQAWVHDHARQHLPPWLRQVSEECGLSYARASVRAQKTRWGSCSARGHINLNRHLLFLPAHLVRYVMIHELCHTVHLNHSQRYWRLVGRFSPDFQGCEAELRRAAGHIPLWACPE